MRTHLNKTIEWDVRKAPVSIQGINLLQRSALLRNDTNQLLGIVSPAYNCLSNASFMLLNEMIAATGRFKLYGYEEFCNGKKLMAYLRENAAFEISGHEAVGYLVIGNSHDGSTRLYVGTASKIIRCQNQFYQTTEVLKLSHSLKIIPCPEMVDKIILAYDQGNHSLSRTFDSFRHTPLQGDAVPELISEIWKQMKYDDTAEKYSTVLERPMARKMIDSITSELQSLGNNYFGLFNGITHYTSHNTVSVQKSFSSVHGTAARINQVAFDFCKNKI